MPEERGRHYRNKEKRRTSASGWQLIAIQSISCVVILLIAFIFRMIGGSAFDQLRDSFNDSIMSNSLIATIAAMFDMSEDTDSSKSGGDVESEPNTTDSTTAQKGSGTTTTDAPDESGTSTTASSNGNSTTKAASTTTGKTSAATKVAATGGSDIPVSGKTVVYAPENVSLLPLRMNRTAAKPLENGTITSRFGYRENPTKGGESFHLGLDIGANYGTPIASMFYGMVSEIGQNSSYGNYVKLFYGNGLYVLYAHCSEILVVQNTFVRAGEVVAKVGSTGDSTGPHVHIQIELNGLIYDPAGVVPMDAYV